MRGSRVSRAILVGALVLGELGTPSPVAATVILVDTTADEHGTA